MRLSARAAALLAVAVFALSVPASVSFAQDGADTPEFKTDKAKEAFAEGLKLFESGEYTKAKKKFQTAERGAKSKADRTKVKAWTTACSKSMPAFVGLQKLYDAKQYNRAYDAILRYLPKQRGTPAEKPFMTLYRRLEAALFQNLETFDIPKTRIYSQKYGKTFIKDPKLVVKGQCLHWTNKARPKETAQLKVESGITNWSGFDAVEFWVFPRSSVSTNVILMSRDVKQDKTKTGRPPVVKPGQKFLHFFTKQVKFKPNGRWQYKRIPLKEFQSQGGASLTQIVDFRLQVRAGPVFDMLVDEIRVRRKDPGAASSKSSSKKGGRR